MSKKKVVASKSGSGSGSAGIGTGTGTGTGSGTRVATPLSLHTLHLIFLLGILQPSLLFLSLFYLPQRASTTTPTQHQHSIFTRGWSAIAHLYDDPDTLTGPGLREAVLPSGAIAIFITQAYLARALGKWIHSDKQPHPRDTGGSLEQLAMTILTLPLSTFGFVLILTALLGAPVPFTDTADTIATIALAFHLALLVALVPAHVLGSDTALWDTVFLPAAAAPSLAQDKKTVVRATKEPWHAVVFYPAAGALLGALLASFGLALDWGRPWQIWPLPPLLGSSAGLVLGNWLGIYAWAKGAWTARVSSLS